MPHDAFFELGIAELRTRKPAIAEETIRAQGSTVGALLHAGAMMAEDVEVQGALEDEAGYLDTASGDALTRYVASQHGIARQGVTAARVDLLLHRAVSTPLTINPGTIYRHVETGVRFTADVVVAWANGDTSDKSQSATAAVVGPDGNVPAGDWVAETSLGETITITSAQPAAGGNPEETDAQLVARVRYEEARKVRGTRRAVIIGASEVEAVREVSVFESVTGGGIPSGGITIVLGDSQGNGNDLLEDAVVEELEEWRPMGAYPEATSSTVRMEGARLRATWDTGQATAENKRRLQQAAAARINMLKARSAPDGTTPEKDCLLSHAVLLEVRPAVTGLKYLEVELPVGTVEPDFGEVIKTDPSGALIEVV